MTEFGAVTGLMNPCVCHQYLTTAVTGRCME